ncbi:MAG TPA: hypothetical protein VIR29_04530 [Anseongella sp.]
MKRLNNSKFTPKFHVYSSHVEAEEASLKNALKRSFQERIDFMYNLINLSIRMQGGYLKPKKDKKPDLLFKWGEKQWMYLQKNP